MGCPDLALSNFHLFPQLKQHLGGRRFENEDDLKEEVEIMLTSMAVQYDAALKQRFKNVLKLKKLCRK